MLSAPVPLFLASMPLSAPVIVAPAVLLSKVIPASPVSSNASPAVSLVSKEAAGSTIVTSSREAPPLRDCVVVSSEEQT